MKRGGGISKNYVQKYFQKSFKQLIKKKFTELYKTEEQEQNQTKPNNNNIEPNQLLKINLALECITDFFSDIQDIQDIPTQLPVFLNGRDILEYQRIYIEKIMKRAIKAVENEEQKNKRNKPKNTSTFIKNN